MVFLVVRVSLSIREPLITAPKLPNRHMYRAESTRGRWVVWVQPKSAKAKAGTPTIKEIAARVSLVLKNSVALIVCCTSF